MDELQRLNDALDRLEKANKSSVIKGIVMALVPTVIVSIFAVVVSYTVLQQTVISHNVRLNVLEVNTIIKRDFSSVLSDIDHNFTLVNDQAKPLIRVKYNYDNK